MSMQHLGFHFCSSIDGHGSHQKLRTSCSSRDGLDCLDTRTYSTLLWQSRACSHSLASVEPQRAQNVCAAQAAGLMLISQT